MSKVPYVRLIRQFAEATPERVTVVCENESLTCDALERRSNRLARAYASLGVGEGDTVSFCLPNSSEYFITCVAIWKLGAIPNPLSTHLPEAELRAIIDLANPKLVVGVTDTFEGRPTLPLGFTPDPALFDGPLPEKISPRERAMTSGGSTGRPKLILLANPALYDQDHPPQLFTPKKASLVPGPLYHAGLYSTAWGGVFAGAKSVVMNHFDPEQALKLIEEHQIDRVFFVPTMLNRIWRLPEAVRKRYDVSSLSYVLSTGAPCAPWLFRAWIEWLGPERMFESYGPSERIGRTFITGSEWLQRPGSVGKAVDCQLKILDKEGNPAPAGVVGEIFMIPATGPGSTFLYKGAERRVLADGWESVGDMGYLDNEGYLYFSDRRTDMILCGGRNIFPAEIEGALNAHPAVRASVVVGLPDDDLGQRIHAIIETSSSVTEEALREHLEHLLVRYKCPHSFEFVTYALFNEAGKVRRSQLRAERITAPEASSPS